MGSWWLSLRFQGKVGKPGRAVCAGLQPLHRDPHGMIPGEGVGVQSMWRPKEGRVPSNVHLHRKAQTFVCSHMGRGPRQETASGLEPLQRTSTKAMPSRNVGPEPLQRVPTVAMPGGAAETRSQPLMRTEAQAVTSCSAREGPPLPQCAQVGRHEALEFNACLSSFWLCFSPMNPFY